MIHLLVFGNGDDSPPSLSERQQLLAARFKDMDRAKFVERESLALKRFREWYGNQFQGSFSGGLMSLLWESERVDFNPVCTSNYIDDPLSQPSIDWTN